MINIKVLTIGVVHHIISKCAHNIIHIHKHCYGYEYCGILLVPHNIVMDLNNVMHVSHNGEGLT